MGEIMAFSQERRKEIFDKTHGKCHICGVRLSFKKYGQLNIARAWEVEHSKPQSKGGSHHLNNLYPAHIDCNRSKGNRSTRTVRAIHGRTKAPLSKEKKEAIQANNTAGGSVAGLGLGMLMGLTPVGLITATIIGGVFGNSLDPEDDL
jgi:hypothetical protein